MEPRPKKNRLKRWLWPLGLAAAGIGAATVYILRGCWHSHMSWPIRYNDSFSYRTCTECGIKRLFDPLNFREYGGYGYDVEELIARATARAASMKKAG